MQNIIGPTFRAMPVTTVPNEPIGQSFHAASVTTGNIAAGLGAGSSILHFRWTSATHDAYIYSVTCDGIFASTAFTAGNLQFVLRPIRPWTGPTGGGSLASLTNNSSKLNSASAASQAPEVRIATTSTLTNGTGTVETLPLGHMIVHTSGGTSSATPIIGNLHVTKPEIFRADGGLGSGPIVFHENEGFSLFATSVPATGVWTVGFTIRWMEKLIS